MSLRPHIPSEESFFSDIKKKLEQLGYVIDYRWLINELVEYHRTSDCPREFGVIDFQEAIEYPRFAQLCTEHIKAILDHGSS